HPWHPGRASPRARPASARRSPDTWPPRRATSTPRPCRRRPARRSPTRGLADGDLGPDVGQDFGDRPRVREAGGCLVPAATEAHGDGSYVEVGDRTERDLGALGRLL